MTWILHFFSRFYVVTFQRILNNPAYKHLQHMTKNISASKIFSKTEVAITLKLIKIFIKITINDIYIYICMYIYIYIYIYICV